LEALEILCDWFPPTHEGPEVMGEISREAAETTGLGVGTPVVGGGGDQAVGVGAIRPEVVTLTLGTSGVVFAATAEPFGRV
jgi:xylulokinase